MIAFGDCLRRMSGLWANDSIIKSKVKVRKVHVTLVESQHDLPRDPDSGVHGGTPPHADCSSLMEIAQKAPTSQAFLLAISV